jgi:hypothetical protein
MITIIPVAKSSVRPSQITPAPRWPRVVRMGASEKLLRRAAVRPVDAEKFLVRIRPFPDDAPVGLRGAIQLQRRAPSTR